MSIRLLEFSIVLAIVLHYAGFPGIQIGTHVNDWNLDDERLLPVFAVSKQE